MKQESKLTSLAQQHNRLEYDMLSRKSIQWLQKNIATLRDPARLSREITKERFRGQNKLLLGNLYFFGYDPKLADKLPHYDVFPLVLVLDKYSNGFLGLNLHYLPVMLRASFMDKLHQYALLDNDDNINKLRVTYMLLSSVKSLRAYQPCLKQYLYTQMVTKPLRVEPHEWETALFLPVEQFRKEKKSIVQKESIKQINSRKLWEDQ